VNFFSQLIYHSSGERQNFLRAGFSRPDPGHKAERRGVFIFERSSPLASRFSLFRACGKNN
jgi:hypothetical protein